MLFGRLGFQLCVLLPLAVIALVQTYYARQVSRWPAKHDVHNALLTLLQSALTVILVTEVTKRYVGRCVVIKCIKVAPVENSLDLLFWSWGHGDLRVRGCKSVGVFLSLGYAAAMKIFPSQ